MDFISRKKRSEVMAAIRSKHTKPEIALRKLLRASGWAYKLYYGKEKIDIAFTGKKIAVFVDGCFWHGCPLHGHIPKSNKAYWVPKLRKNKERAKKKNARLKATGWKPLHIWEHELKNPKKAIAKIKKALRS